MKHTYKNNQLFRKAFTLVELLIVIAIIGILFIVLISKVDFATDKAKATGVQTDFRSFQMAFETVARENSGFSELVDESYEKLEIAINKNLDNKLKIDIDADGKITMINDAKDPWGTEYHGVYLSGNDGNDRGVLIIYSNGADMTFGSDISITGGVASISTTNDSGKDDYSVATVYGISNGGNVQTIVTGFGNSNKQTTNNQNNAPGTENGGGDDNNDDVVEEDNVEDTNTDTPFDPTQPYDSREPGLYKTGTNTLLYSWTEMEELGIIVGGKGAGAAFSTNPTAEVVDFLRGDLHFPTTITSLQTNAFAGCRYLTGIMLSPATEHFSQYAFSGLSLKTLVIYEGKPFGHLFDGCQVENIYFSDIDALLTSGYSCHISSYSALMYRSNPIRDYTNIYVNGGLLEHLVVPDGYDTIASGLFAEYSKLKTVTLSSDVKTIKNNAFERCVGLESINLNNVETLGNGAFKSASKLTNVELGNIQTIGMAVFEDCSSLLTAKIGSSATKIGCVSFVGNKDFSLHYDGDLDTWNNLIYNESSIYEYSGISTKQYKLYIQDEQICGNFVTPEHWTSVGNYAFSNVSGLTSVVLNNNITSVGKYAFSNTDITYLDLNDGLLIIGQNAFSNNDFAIVDLPDSVTTLNSYAFASCQQMTTFNINESSQLTTIGDSIFNSCKSLQSIFIPPLVTCLDSPNFVLGADNLREFKFSPNSQLEYLSVKFGHVGYVTIYLPDSVKVIKDLDINVNSRSALVIGENSQLERMEGRIFDRYYSTIYIPKNLSYISPTWASYQFIPTVTIHPENTNFMMYGDCLIDIVNKCLLASKKDNVVPIDGSVTSIAKSGGWGIDYIPKVITEINAYAFENATGYSRTLTYEGTIEEWKSHFGWLAGVKEIICSDGTIDTYGNIIE